MRGTLDMKAILLSTVLLVAPSASLAGPIPAPEPHQQAIVLPWGQGTASPGGFIYCAGCSPINPQQLVLPSDVPVNRALPALQASGVLPPEQRLNGLGGAIQEPGTGAKIWDDGSVPIQQMALHDDGRYSFSYDTAHSSRQEERNLDGSVHGSYSYTDPDGKLIQIGYTAGTQGYQAIGDNVPPQPVLQLPVPVHDTAEVQEARQRFLETYAATLARIEKQRKDAAEKSAEKQGENTEGEADHSVIATEVEDAPQEQNDEVESEVAPAPAQEDGDALIVTGKSETVPEDAPQEDVAAQQDEVDDGTDAIVVPADVAVDVRKEMGEDKPQPQQSPDIAVPVDSSASASLPSPSYQITIPIGIGPNAGLSVQPSPLPLPPHHQQPINRQNVFVQPGVVGLPQPVLDTPEVQAARQRFFEAYNKELERIQKAQQEALERAKNAPVSETENGNQINENDSDNDNKKADDDVANSNNDNSVNAKSNLQPYFYYVSVGGAPHYVTSLSQPGSSSPYPTSLKATLLGAQPLAAVHNAQVPNRGKSSGDQQINGQIISGAEIRPVFLDLENSVQENQNKENSAQTSLNNQNQNQQSVKVNPILGQLVPLGLAPVNNGGSSVQIGYIPGIILNNGGVSTQNSADGSQQSSVNGVPASFTLSLNVPQQQNQSPQASSNSNIQPVILLASKK